MKRLYRQAHALLIMAMAILLYFGLRFLLKIGFPTSSAGYLRQDVGDNKLTWPENYPKRRKEPVALHS